jgi:hypothetical protein
MRTTILFAFVALVGLSALAQPGSTFTTSFDPNPQNMFQADKGYLLWSIGKYVYVINGFIKNGNSDRKNQVYMIDADTRQIIKEIEFDGPQGDMAITAYWITSDGYILLSGEWRDKAANFTMRMFLAKLNPDLEIVWINYYPDLSANYLYSEGITETANGNYFLYLVEAPAPEPHPTSELSVVKTDTSGTILMYKILTDTFAQTAGYGYITPTDDGFFLISSFAIDYYYHPVLGTYRYIAFLHKIDAAGNQLWTRSLNYAKIDNQPPHSTSLAGGSGTGKG